MEVITGKTEQVHPSRKKIAGKEEGILYDLLLEAQNKLIRGERGLDKPMSCSASLLIKVAKRKPDNMEKISQILGERKADRFGFCFSRYYS